MGYLWMDQMLATQEANITSIGRIIRPELNLEKWPNIWTPAQSRTKPRLRTLVRKNTLENGNIICSKVTIDPSLQYGNLTTEDQKTWYALLQLWEQSGKPQTLTFSLRELARTLGKSWSVKTYESLKKSLKRLNISTFSWENSYYDSKTKKTLDIEDSFHIISELRLAKVSEEHTINNEQCSCRFSELLYQNLISNYTKPVCFGEILKIRSGVAQLIYKYLELVMYNKDYYERTSENLFDDIGLDRDEYKFVSARKKVLFVAIKELKEIKFPTGILKINIEETIDKSDWKLVVNKLTFTTSTTNKADKKQETKTVKEITKQIIEQTPLLKREALSYFIERFGLRREATKTELDVAENLIKKYQLNLEQVKQFVDYAKCAAIETNYSPKNFNGIVQYIGEALNQQQAQELKTQFKEKTKNCNFCNEAGLIGVLEKSGRRATMYCPHDPEILKLKATKWDIEFEFWSTNPPEFIY